MKVRECLYCGKTKLTAITVRSDGVGVIRCDACRVMMVEEISDHTEELYTKEYFEKSAETDYGYSTYMSSPTANIIGKFAFASLFGEGRTHVDLGSADGSLIEIFQEKGYESQGLEISADAVEVAREKGVTARVSNLHVFPKDIKNIDIITAYDLLEHADHPGKVLKNVSKSLSDDGVFVFSTLSVKKLDPTDYWFNHSLEHYIYYTAEGLTNVLTDVFGKDNFAFFEAEINGVAEFWGFAKKRNAERGRGIIKLLRDSKTPKDPDQAYFFSLFYNQLSRFTESEAIVTSNKTRWGKSRATQAVFYLNYIQGKLERALADTADSIMYVASKEGVFWRAYYQAEKDFNAIIRKQEKIQSDAKMLAFQEQAFTLQNEIQNLRGSRVVGRIIKARDVAVGRIYPRVKGLPRSVVRYAKNGVGAFLPMSTKQAIGERKRAVLNKLRGGVNSQRNIVEESVVEEGGVLISIVVPYYNRADTIDETLQSLTEQTYTKFEVIIVDDGSPDEASVKKAKSLMHEYPTLHMTVKHQENAGVAAARNYGISLAKGKYIICLDSDDILTSTYIEKMLIVLETDPEASVVTTYREDFGVRNKTYKTVDYNPAKLIRDNMVTTAAAFRRTAWEKSSGFKSDLGYEDWDFWITLAEQGDWGRTLREPLFRYRVAMQSRFSEDKSVHWSNLRKIKNLHPQYAANIKRLQALKSRQRRVVKSEGAFINLSSAESYVQPAKPAVLIAIPWMNFGGAETLLYNFTRKLKTKYDIAFVTGIASDNEWEYKFREVSDKIYHLPQLFPDARLYTEFISNYIHVHHIDILHIVHSGYVFDMLPELKARHPKLKVVVTMFNDRVEEYTTKSVKYKSYIDAFNTDSKAVADSYAAMFEGAPKPTTIPNGIDCFNEFNPTLFDRDAQRREYKLADDDLAVFFVGRLSEEKNPDVFIRAAEEQARTSSDAKRIHYFVVGDGPMRKECEELIRHAKHAHITYLGYQKDVAKFLSSADIFILPSSIEGFPLSILEAMSMSLAVIASRVGGVPDVIKDGINGYVVTPGSVEEIVSSISKLTDPKHLSKIKTNNRKQAEQKYSIQELGARYNTLYREVLK